MAIYKGREVQLLGRVSGGEESPLYRVMDKNMNVEHVSLSQMQFTAEEKKNLERDHGAPQASSLQVIEEKDLKELREGQDRKKIEERQKSEQKNKDVPVSNIKVNADEVARKAGK